MNTRLQKWGNSLAVRLSKETLESLRLKEGDAVTIHSNKLNIVIKPVQIQKVSLKTLVSKITKKNIHTSVWDNDIQGKEIW